MCLEEGGHAPVGHAVPHLDAPVLGAADEVFACVAPPDISNLCEVFRNASTASARLKLER